MDEAFYRPAARRIESIQVGYGAFDGIQVHLIVRMTQVVPEATNCCRISSVEDQAISRVGDHLIS